MGNRLYVGITGKAYSGKDTTANLLVEQLKSHGIKAVRVGLADALKQEASEIIKVPVEKFYDSAVKEKLRPFMQFLGDFRKYTEFGGYQMYWCDRLSRDVVDQYPDAQVVIVSDVRYDFEAEWVRMEGGSILEVVGIGAKETLHSSHQSENGISRELVDAQILNDHTIGVGSLSLYLNTLVTPQIVEALNAS